MALSIHSQIKANKIKSALFMVFFILVAYTLVYVFAKASGYGPGIAIAALIFSMIMSIGSYLYSDRIILSLSGARVADRVRDFDLYTVTENIAIAAGIPKPKVFVIEDSALNAFATGRDPHHAVVCVTRGLIESLERRELEGVIAHEISHIMNYDTRLMTIVSVLIGTIAFAADWFSRTLWWGSSRKDDRGSSWLMIVGIILAVISPIIASIIHLAISRKREYLADASGALLTRNPRALAQALIKISSDKEVLEAATNGTAHLYIANPFKDKSFHAWFAGLFNTHPPIEDRIRILRSM